MAAVTLVVDRYELGPLQTNCVVVRRERGAEEALVVDPGGDITELRLELARMGATVVAILLTHGHWDHVLGVAALAEATGAPIYIGAEELPELESGLTELMGVPNAPAFTPDHLLSGGETLALAGLEVEVVAVPGHRPGHLAFAASSRATSSSAARSDAPISPGETGRRSSPRSRCWPSASRPRRSSTPATARRRHSAPSFAPILFCRN